MELVPALFHLPLEVGSTKLERTWNKFQLRSNFTIGRSVASTYCVSLSGCPWPLGYLCADFCAQNQPRWPQAVSCFRAHMTSPRQCSSRDPSRGGQPHLRTSLQHSSDGTVKKSGAWFGSGILAPVPVDLATYRSTRKLLDGEDVTTRRWSSSSRRCRSGVIETSFSETGG